MTAPQPGRPHVLERPACTPAAIRAVLAANAGPEILHRYDAELDAAFEQARRDENLTVLVRTVRRWWFEADAWRDWHAMLFAAAAAVLCCCTSPWNRGLGLSNYAF